MRVQAKLTTKLNGYTLVELLVGLFLSLFIVMMTITYVVTSARTFSAQSNEMLIQENARFALDYVSRIIREGGSDPSNTLEFKLSPIYSGARCSADAHRPSLSTGSITCSVDELTVGSDRLAIAKVLYAQTTACDGSDIFLGAGEVLSLATILWSADIDQDGIRSLYCQSLNIDTGEFIGLATPVIEGVDLIQFQFGLDTDKDGVIDQYQNQTFRSVQTPEVSSVEAVRAVRFAVLISPGSGIHRDQIIENLLPRSYQLLDGMPVTLTDRLPRSVFSTTVMLPSVN